MKDDKTNYRNRRLNRNKNYDTTNTKKNLLVASNDGDEVKNILSFNEEVKDIPNYDNLEVVPRNTKKKKLNFSFNNKYLKYGLSLSVFLVALLGVSYSFFNYRKEDSRQADISSGAVYVKLVENTQSINLTKMYPRTDEEARERNDNYFDFTVKGKNTSETKAIVYAIDIIDGETISGKTRIDRNYIKVDLQEKVGNEYVYIKEGESLSDFSFTGILQPNTTSEITKEYRLRLWIGDNVIISDTDPDATFTQAQFNNLYATYGTSVDSEDRTVVDRNAYNVVKAGADTATVIDFSASAGSTNGEGIYRLLGTENDNYPVYYYRGDIDNNNVIFGGYCWQMVRTTDTGGVKMIYNGIPDISGSGDNITYNCGPTRDIQNTTMISFSLKNTTGYYYADDYEIVSVTGNNVTYRLKQGTNPITQEAIGNATVAAQKIPTIAANYPYTCRKTTSDATCNTLYKVVSYDSETNANMYSSDDRLKIGNGYMNSGADSVSDVGYMNNARYAAGSTSAASNSIYGKNIEWNSNTNRYLLIEDTAGVASTNKTRDSDHHYTCGTANTSSCSSVRYYYYTSYYIELQNGDLLEDAIYKMTGNGSEAVKARNNGYNLNQNDSPAKIAIDNWFRTTLTNEVNVNNPDYSLYLEDTVFCNDRTFKTEGDTTYSKTYLQSGWNPNGGSTMLFFGTNNRFNSSWYGTSNVPSMTCPKEIDSFTVSNENGNGELTYPVGLLTADEVILAGVMGNTTLNNVYTYLYTPIRSWTMTPYFFGEGVNSAYLFVITNNGYLSNDSPRASSDAYRPVISLKYGTEFEEDGDGTPTNPYVVKYN